MFAGGDCSFITHVSNLLDHKTKTTNQNGHVVICAYGRLDRSKIALRQIGVEQYFYDEAGNRIRKSIPMAKTSTTGMHPRQLDPPLVFTPPLELWNGRM